MSVPGVRPATAAHPGPVTHLREGGAQPGHVRGLVGADVGDQRGGLSVAGHQVGVAQHRLGPAEAVEGGDLDEQQPDHPADHHLQGEVDVVGEDPLAHRRPAELGQLRGRLGRGVDAHAGEHPGRLVIGDRVLEGDVPGHEPHAVVAGASSKPASSRAWASNRPRSMWAMAVPAMSSSKQREKSGTGGAGAWPRTPRPCRCG